MNIIQLPRITGSPEERVKQIENFIFTAVRQYNQTVEDLERQINELKGAK